jgi:alpha-L-rhamnosidase
MWERWDSVRPDGTFQDPAMNSFNHYAYGSVGQWMYANIAGISAARPGYREVLIRPRPGGGINSARATLTSVRGPISTRWTRKRGRFELTCSIPPNTTAEVWVPASATDHVTHAGGTLLRHEDGHQVFHVGSGTYRFTV